jgi:hypothetical protein
MGIVGSLFGNDEASEEVEGEVIEQEEAQTADPVEEAEEAEPGHGVEPQDEPEAEQATDETPTTSRQMAPVGAVKAERQKRQEAERKAAEYQAELEKIRAAQRQPDQYNDDPYFNEFREKVRAEMFEERLLDSDERAREKYGPETVAEAAEWAKSRMAVDPTLKASFLASRKPIEMLVEQFQRDQKVSALLTDEEAYIRRRAAELGLFANADHGAASEAVEPIDEPAPAPVSNKPVSKPVPRRSLAGGQSHGRATDVPSGRLSAVSSLFR